MSEAEEFLLRESKLKFALERYALFVSRLQYHPYYVPSRCIRPERRKEKEMKKGTEPHYVCKSDSALNKILTDQSNVLVGGREEGGRRTRASLHVCECRFFFPFSDEYTFFFRYSLRRHCLHMYTNANVCAHTHRSRG